jgi:hypothetical protein
MYEDLHYVIPSGYNGDFENNTKTMNMLCGQNFLKREKKKVKKSRYRPGQALKFQNPRFQLRLSTFTPEEIFLVVIPVRG